MRVPLGTFACSCIETRFGGDVAVAVEAALHDYVGQLESQPRALPVPDFWLDFGATETTAEVDVRISPSMHEALGVEARRQGLPVERLLTHAVFVYLADAPSTDRPTRGWKRALHCLQSRKNPWLRVVT